MCADTVLFPEGGGQNTDHGTIDNVRVLAVTRVGSTAVHMLDTPVEVILVSDWSIASNARFSLVRSSAMMSSGVPDQSPSTVTMLVTLLWTLRTPGVCRLTMRDQCGW